MSALLVGAVMDEVAARMGVWGDYEEALFVRSYGWPNPVVSPPAFVVGFPPSLNFDASYDRGVDRIPDLPCWALMGKPDERSSRDHVVQFVEQIKERIEAPGLEDTFDAWSSSWVKTVSFETVANDDGTEFIAARFTVDIAS